MFRVDSTTAATDADTEARRAGPDRTGPGGANVRATAWTSEKYLSGQSTASSCKARIHADKGDTGLSAFKPPPLLLQLLAAHFDAPRSNSAKSETDTY